MAYDFQKEMVYPVHSVIFIPFPFWLIKIQKSTKDGSKHVLGKMLILCSLLIIPIYAVDTLFKIKGSVIYSNSF